MNYLIWRFKYTTHAHLSLAHTHIFIYYSSQFFEKNQHFQRSNITGWWLYTHPSEKYDFVSWDDDIPNINGNKNGNQTTNQLGIKILRMPYDSLVNPMKSPCQPNHQPDQVYCWHSPNFFVIIAWIRGTRSSPSPRVQAHASSAMSTQTDWWRNYLCLMVWYAYIYIYVYYISYIYIQEGVP